MSDRGANRSEAMGGESGFRLEMLEPRLLLTTLTGSEVFEFRDSTDQLIRITTQGKLVVELLGASVDEANGAQLHDLPGVILASDIGRGGSTRETWTRILGGPGGEDGIIPVTLHDDTGAYLVGPPPQDEYTLECVAVNNAGDVWAVRYYQDAAGADVVSLVHIVITPTADGYALVSQTEGNDNLALSMKDFGGGGDDWKVTSVKAADFDPISGLLLFVADVGREEQLDTLYSVDVSTGVITGIAQGNLQDGADNNSTVESIAFDQISEDDADLLVYRTFDSVGEGRVAELGTFDVPDHENIGTIKTNNPDPAQRVTIFGGAGEWVPLTTIKGIELVRENTDGPDDWVYAITSEGGDSRVMRIRRSDGETFSLGPLSDPDDPDAIADSERVLRDGAIRGEDLGSLAWDPTRVNPFTGDLGVLISIDISTDEVVYIDDRDRFPSTNLYQIYVVQGDPAGFITIGVVDEQDARRPLLPFDGTTGQFMVEHAQGPGLFPLQVAAPGDSGGVLIGIKTLDLDPLDPYDQNRTILHGDIFQEVGVRPEGATVVWAGLEATQSLLGYVSSSTVLGNRLMGQNVDDVQGMAVLGNGRQAYVIDNDAVTADGVRMVTPADQLFLVDTSTGRASSGGIDIFTGATNLFGVQALALHQSLTDGSETLYAVYEVAGDLQLGAIEPDTGEFTGVVLGLSAPGISVDAMAFSPDQRLYVVATDATGEAPVTRLYEVNRLTGGTVGLPVTLSNGGDPVRVPSMDFVVTAQGEALLLAHDRYNGRLVDIDLGTGVMGGVVATAMGSLSPTVGAISYDAVHGQIFAADNVTGSLVVRNEGAAAESSVLMRLAGFESGSAENQDLGKFLLGGTITGKVDISGSMDLFYAGWVLTGQGQGLLEDGHSTQHVIQGNLITNSFIAKNFRIGEDLNNLITVGSLGTHTLTGQIDDPLFVSGFDIYVGGRLGQVKSLDTFMGSVQVENLDTLSGLSRISDHYLEIEKRLDPDLEPDVRIAWEFELYARLAEAFGGVSEEGLFTNDTFNTPEYLGSLRSSTAGENSVRIDGVLEAVTEAEQDWADYYAVGLMAGQTVTVRLQGSYNINVGVFDPTGRLVATNYTNSSLANAGAQIHDASFQVTVDRPGVYRFAIAQRGDWNLNGTWEDGENVLIAGSVSYTLSISNVGEIGWGGLTARAQVFDPVTWQYSGHSYLVNQGDLGALVADALSNDTSRGVLFSNNGGSGTVQVLAGNLRAIAAFSVGLDRRYDQFYAGGPSVLIPQGSVGYVRATGDTGVLSLNPSEALASGNRIGGDFQVIEAANLFNGLLYAEGSIGVVRAKTMAPEVTLYRSAFVVGDGGRIDLIDVAEAGGTATMGGPHIETGVGGNVRFMRVGGNLYPEFGSLDSGEFVLREGESKTVIDDSGGRLTFAPIDELPNPSFSPVDGQSPQFLPNMLKIRTYGVWGGGGSVVVDVTALRGGISVTGTSAAAEVGKLMVDVTGLGDAVDLETAKVSIQVQGSHAIDVFEVAGTEGLNFGQIINGTRGAIVNTSILGSIDELRSRGDLGLVESSTGAAVEPIRVVSAEAPANYPFQDQRIGIVARAIGEAWAGGGVGNFIISGDIGLLMANSDGQLNFNPYDDKLEGIAAPVLAANIGDVNIGEGIAPSGTGWFSRAGLYSLGTMGIVSNQGVYSDIRGDVVALSVIAGINLHDGAIINADIMQVDALDMSQEFPKVRFSSDDGGYLQQPEPDIGHIRLTGMGGMIGSVVQAADIGPVNVGGFGIFSSDFNAPTGVIYAVRASGYGVRASVFSSLVLQGLTAEGNGTSAGTDEFTPSATLSESRAVDPYGYVPNFLTDLHAYLGTDKDHRTHDNVTVTGVIEGTVVELNLDLWAVSAWQIRNSALDAANSIRSIHTTGVIDGLEVTTGKLIGFTPATDVDRLDMNIRGPIVGIVIRGNLGGNSSIAAYGPGGNIQSVVVMGNLVGSIHADGVIGTIGVGGDLSGSISVDNTPGGKVALGRLTVDGSVGNGSVDINGNVGSIETARSLGAAGDTLRVGGDVGTLRVGTDKRFADSTLGLNMTVLGDLGRLEVNGTVGGRVMVDGDLASLAVCSHQGGAAQLLGGPMAIRGNLGSATFSGGDVSEKVGVTGAIKSFVVKGGDLAAELTAGGDIGNVSITDGDLAAAGAISSALGGIGGVTVKGGLLGVVRVPQGTIAKIAVLGTGLGPASLIAARALGALQVAGSMLAGAVVDVEQSLTSLVVGQDVQALAAVVAGSAGSVMVGGNLAGGLTVGYCAKGTKLTVGGDAGSAGGLIDIDADTQVAIGGDMVEGSTLVVRRDLKTLTAADLLGNLLVGGGAASVRLDSMETALVVVAFDLDNLAVRGQVAQSVVQAGVSRGGDGTYDSGASRTGRMGSFTAAEMTDSIVAAGGDIGRVGTASLSGTSVSSGLALAGATLDLVRGGALDLSGAGMRNFVRQESTLYRGDIGAAAVGAMTGSQVTAGVSPGIDGNFMTAGDNDLTTSLTGGNSQVRAISATLDGSSAVLADGGVGGSISGGTINGDVTYDLNDLTGDMGTLIGEATAGAPLTFTAENGSTVVVTLTGQGTVGVYDEAGADSDNLINGLTLEGTGSSSKLVVTTLGAGGVGIGRIISADDATLGSLSLDTELRGDGTDAVDLWLDGAVADLRLAGTGSGWRGQIGGGVNNMTLAQQGPGALRVGGAIKRLTIGGSDVTPLVEEMGGAVAGTNITQMACTGGGDTWVYNAATQRLGRANLATGVLSNLVALQEELLAAVVVPVAMDFTSANQLRAVAQVWDPSPTQSSGLNMATWAVNLRGLAVSATGRVVAIDSSSGSDRLMEINPTTGGVSEIGIIRERVSNSDYSQQVRQLAFDNSGNLYALVSDRDGTGTTFSEANGYGLGRLDTTPVPGTSVLYLRNPAGSVGMPAVALDGGGVTAEFTGLAVNAGGAIYAVRRDGGADALVRLVVAGSGAGTTVTQNNVGQISVGGATSLVGIGFGQGGELVGLSDGDMVVISTAAPGSSAVLMAGAVGAAVNTFAVGRSGSTFSTYAYDTSGMGRFYNNRGTAYVLGSLHLGTGNFSRIATLESAPGQPLESAPVAMAVRQAGGDAVYVAAADGKFYAYTAGGALADSAHTVRDIQTNQALSIAAMDFNAAGELVGLDATQNRLVTLGLGNGLATGRLPAGSVAAEEFSSFTFDAALNRFVGYRGGVQESFAALRAQTMVEYGELVGAITAETVDKLDIRGEYSGQVVTTGRSFKSVTAQGDFAGRLMTEGTIGSYQQKGGDFWGLLYGGRGVDKVSILDGDVLVGGTVESRGNLKQFEQRGGGFNGRIDVATADKIRIQADVGGSAYLRSTGAAGSVEVGALNGGVALGSVSKCLKVNGDVRAEATIDILGDVGALMLGGDTLGGSEVQVFGTVRTLQVAGTHAGALAVRDGAGNVTFGRDIESGQVLLGGPAVSLTVNGQVSDGLVSLGVWWGDDAVYNTADDVIFGGGAQKVTFQRDFLNSAVVAGVLPSLSEGPGLPANLLAYTGVEVGGSLVDTAEAGGVRRSSFGRVLFGGNTNGSVMAAADGVGLWAGLRADLLTVRSYGDAVGAPTVADSELVLDVAQDAMGFSILLSEPVDSGSLVLAVDADEDGVATGASDTYGTVQIVLNGQIVSDWTMTYTIIQDGSDGRGLLTLRAAEPLTAGIYTVTVRSDALGQLVDFSGLRSGLRDFNRDGTAGAGEDPFGTMLDGDADLVEGGEYSATFKVAYNLVEDVPSYLWWFGCAPTSVAMVIGYYDRLEGYEDLIDGDASTQTQAVLDAIASPGDGVYEFDSNVVGTHYNVITEGTAGTGHIPDYALYEGIADSSGSLVEDLSTLNPGVAHVSDSMADFMGTSFSALEMSFGGTDPLYVSWGVRQYFAYRGYSGAVQTQDLLWGQFDWATLVREIDAGRPVIVGVDSAGRGEADHAAVAVGYNAETHQYAVYTTWTADDPETPVDEALTWYDFQGVGAEFGIGAAITVRVAAAA